MASWEDELTVRMLNDNSQLEQHMAREEYPVPGDPLKYSFLSAEARETMLGGSEAKAAALKMMNYYWCYRAQIISYRDAGMQREVVGSFLSQLCMLRQINLPVLLFSHRPKEWEDHLRNHYPHLHYCAFLGSPQNKDSIIAL
jgi:hypothetical protein